jgi:hypothetical protein
LGAKKLLNHSSLMGLAVVATINLAEASMVCRAGGQFDGQWVGTAPEAGDCGVLTVTLTVVDDRVTGTVIGRHGTATSAPRRLRRMERRQSHMAEPAEVQSGFQATPLPGPLAVSAVGET